MNEVDKNLGHATAYGYAKSKGYTGTEEEFAELMEDYAEVGERAEAAATAAAASATAASDSASDSAASATAAEGFAGNASTSAGNASQAAQNASQSATAASGSATSAAGSATAAEGSATTAGDKATEAAQNATAAAGSATTAGASATAAQAAQTAAEAAQTAAETAQGAAEDAAESIEASAAQIAQNTADISLVKNALEAITDVENPVVSAPWESWEYGGIYSSSGLPYDRTDRKRTVNYLKESDYVSVAANGTELYIYRYSYNGSDYTYIGATAIVNDTDPYIFSEDSANYFRLQCNTLKTLSNIAITYRSELVANAKLVPQLVTDVNALKASVQVPETTDLYHSQQYTKYYINWSDGTETAFNDARISDFIPVNEGDKVTYTLTSLGQSTPVIAAYNSSKTYQRAKSVRSTGTSGAWRVQTGEYTVPSDVSYIKFSSYSGAVNTDSCVLTSYKNIEEIVSEIGTQWRNKKWAAFGTSITDTDYTDTHFLQPTGKYPPYLAGLSGMLFTNYGIAGGSITTNVQNKVKQTTLTNFDVVTVEGSVNDHATSKPIGNVGDTGTDTFAGAIYQIAKYVYENSNATLFFITDYVGRYVHINPAPDGSDFYGDCAPSKTNDLGLLQIDYINMMIKQCEYFGIPCITAGQDSGINLLTGNLYLMDHIHSTYAGGKQYAETIWSVLKNVKPRVLSV